MHDLRYTATNQIFKDLFNDLNSSLIGFCNDLKVKWDWIKYKIRQESIRYSKSKAREKECKDEKIEDTLCKELTAEAPTPENLANLEAVMMEYEKDFDLSLKCTQPQFSFS